MSRNVEHQRANEEQIRLLRAELAGQGERLARPHWWTVAGWTAGCVLVFTVYARRGYPLLPLTVSCTAAVTIDALLAREGWSVPPRWAVSLTAAVVLGFALWRG